MLDSDLLNYIEIRSQKTNRCNEVPAKSVTCMFKKKVLYLFKVKRTTNSTYTKEEVGCESSSCSTTIHDNGDGKRICCTTSDCNKDTTAFNTQSNAPSLSFTIAIIFSFFTLCLNIFWNLELIWYTPPFLSKPFHVSQSFVLKLYLLRIFKQFLKTNIALLSWHK